MCNQPKRSPLSCPASIYLNYTTAYNFSANGRSSAQMKRFSSQSKDLMTCLPSCRGSLEKNYRQRLNQRKERKKMSKTNLVQHEQHLKHLEKSIREICDDHKQMYELVHQSWTKSMQLFVITEDLRLTRFEFEKKES